MEAEKILLEQLEHLKNLSDKETVKDEPEQVVSISLAMVEIAKALIID